MFDDFKKAVIDFHNQKKIANQLSENLAKPTLAKLKRESLFLLKTRYQKKDDETIISFFDPEKKMDNHEQRIEKFDTEGFKALHKFLTGKSGIRKEESIKLLAWLIDFEPRPYQWRPGENTEFETKGNGTNPPPLNQPRKTTSLSPNNGIKWTPSKLKSVVVSVMILVIAVGSYIFSKQGRTAETIVNPVLSGKEQCMYWTGEQYRPVACNQKIEGIVVIALDREKVAHLRKITMPDTLTKFSIGKVWWGKINGKVAFYTAGGEHPEDNRKRLLPLSRYMLAKYVTHE